MTYVIEDTAGMGTRKWTCKKAYLHDNGWVELRNATHHDRDDPHDVLYLSPERAVRAGGENVHVPVTGP